MNGNWRYALFVTTTLLLMATHATATPANNPQILHSFCNFHQGCLDGQQPTYLAPGRGGAFYGIDSGAVFRVDPASRNFSIFHHFDGEEGKFSPAWLVSAPNGNLYGALAYDLLPGNAEIFRLSPAGDYTVVHTFYADEDGNVDIPNSAPVEDSQGNWYGTTEFLGGGPLVKPTGATTSATGDVLYADSIYEITRNGVFKTLYAFPGSGDIGVNGLALAPNGNLYGTTQLGGDYGLGSVFRFTPDGVLTTLHSFGAPGAEDEGAHPGIPLIVGADGALYGATDDPAPGNSYPEGGAMFRITLSGQLTTLYDFDDGTGVGYALTLMPDGYFYGIRPTCCNGFNTGIIFRISPTGADYSQLYAFSAAGFGGFYPAAPLLRGFDNALYGTTPNGGKYEGGTLFRYVPPPVQ